MVYILTAKKPQKYKNGRSRIIYIGTTGKGTQRPATSAVDKASEAFGELRGVREIEVYIVTSGTRQAVRTWEHLESSLLAIFLGQVALLRLEAAVTRELQCPAVLRDRPHDVVGSPCGNVRFDLQSDAHR
jgi:hypothetical protein